MAVIYRFQCYKLVRDSMKQILEEKGVKLSMRPLSKDEYVTALHNKIEEENEEASLCVTKPDFIDEMADMLEVMRTLCELRQVTFEEVEEARIKKKEEKGGFYDKIFIDYCELNENSEFLDFYLSQPHRYPQIIKDLVIYEKEEDE